MFAAIMMTCSVSYAQLPFTTIAPSDLNLTAGNGAVNGIFDISSFLNEADNTVAIQIVNGNVSAVDTWTVGENNPTTFILSGSGAAEAFVNHGANLGSEDFQNGSLARDGVTSAAGESFSLDTSTLDSGFTFGNSGNDFFVDYTGPETNSLQTNSVGFVFESDQAVSSFSVFSTNTVNLNNNFTLGFRTVSAVPEPALSLIHI